MEDCAEKTIYSGQLSHKVVAIAAGEAHNLALAGDGSVYSWGRGTFGRLGTGKDNDELLPVRIEFDISTKMKLCAEKSVVRERPKFVEIAAGAYHSLALEDDGSVWCWGYNVYGQLGLNVENSMVPCFLEQFLELGVPDESNANSKTLLKVRCIKAGGMMSLAIDILGALWMWGNCPQLSKISDGEFILSSHPTPSPVWDFHGHTVVKVACGNEHIIAFVSAGETFTGNNLICYSWGNNNHGQLGLGDKESRSRPAIVETFNLESPWEVYEVACGAFHTAVLAHKRIQSDMVDSSDLSIAGQEKKSTCWTFGLGDNGQLGHGTTKSVCLPEPVKDLPQNVSLTSISCGLFHTCVVSSAGDVWSWGMEKGLGLCPDASFTGTDTGDALSPLRYGSKFARPVQVACGAAHIVLVSHDGYKLWSWGRGWSGVLGRGSMVDSYVPTVVMWPPLDEDFKECLDKESGKEKVGGQEAEIATELEKKLSSAMEEVQLLRSKLNLMEKYASILHGSIFGKPFEEQDLPQSLQSTGIFDIAKEWENMLESAEDWKLTRLETFYQKMLAGVKDKLMKRKIQEMIRECLHYSNYGKPGTHVE
ncbi:ultraviolet-B receptor UVR8 [Telopea speciosissima]|uniref:ultraviolet-B receptor UVR8 n=1 Tax=Telopea speciosissima TaxID=54955 RepID=UPI001CC437C1|nr:ultraviolet-B receptor UVR8 [Telopea speciosissima]